MNEEINKAIYDLGSLIEEMTAGTEFSRLNRKMFEYEIGRYMMFLIASDKVITQADAELLNEYLGTNCSAEEFQKAVDADDVYVTRFSSELPLSFEMFVAFDKMYAKSPFANEKTFLSRNFIDLYKSIGNKIVTSENNVRYNGRKNLAAYIDMLERYRDEKLGCG